jgi:hypothetical protein
MAGNIAPKVVTDGLVLYLDAANTKSYPTSGVSWRNLKDTNTNATLTNGPTFLNEKGGVIAFDGIDDVVNLTTNGDTFNNLYFGGLSAGNRSVTLEYFIYFDPILLTPNPDGTFWQEFGSGFVGYYLARRDDTGRLIIMLRRPTAGVNTYHTSAKSIELGKYYHIVFSMTENVNSKWYINGILDSTQTNTDYTFHPSFSNSFKIGQGYSTSTMYSGKVGSLKIYNRALSAAEILQNYNATKTRFI